MPPLILGLVLGSLVLRGVLVNILLRRNLHRRYHFFFAYLSFSIFSTLVRLAVRNHYLAYFYTFWATEAVYTLLSLLVILEAFRSIFREFYRSKGFQILLWCAGIAVSALALGTPVGDSVGVSSITAIILSVSLAVSLLQVGSLLAVCGLIGFFDVRGRKYELGIVLGYGLFASTHLIVVALRSQLGPNYQSVFDLGHPIAYVGSVLVWLYTFSRNEARTRENIGVESPDEASSRLSRLTTAYRTFTSKKPMG